MTPGSFNWCGIENEDPKKLKESSDTELFPSHQIPVAADDGYEGSHENTRFQAIVLKSKPNFD